MKPDTPKHGTVKMNMHHIHKDGGFTAGCTETMVTAYAYPGSYYAAIARKSPEKAAAKMLEDEHKHPNGLYVSRKEYDRMNWADLTQTR